MAEWTRLSETLRGAECAPDTCRACGSREEVACWQEHDDDDRRAPIVVPLCRACSDQVIGPHPRLYRRLTRHEPFPGAMETCLTCQYRWGTTCQHPDLKLNGGAGLRLDSPKPVTGLACTRGKGCRPFAMYDGPSVCHGFEAEGVKGPRVTP